MVPIGARGVRSQEFPLGSLALSRSPGTGSQTNGTPMAYGKEAVWISAGGLTKLDPRANEVATVVPVDEGCCGPVGIGASAGWVILSGPDPGEISAYDPGTGELERIGVSRCVVFSFASDDEGFWAAHGYCGPSILRYEVDRQPGAAEEAPAP